MQMMPFAETHIIPSALCQVLMREGYISHRFLTIAFLRDDLVCTGVGAHACGLIPYLMASNALDEFFWRLFIEDEKS